VTTCGFASCRRPGCVLDDHLPGGPVHRPGPPGAYCAPGPGRCYCGECPNFVPALRTQVVTPDEVADLVAARRRLAIERSHAEALAIEDRLTARANARAVSERLTR
jgi:hypothetical protein